MTTDGKHGHGKHESHGEHHSHGKHEPHGERTKSAGPPRLDLDRMTAGDARRMYEAAAGRKFDPDKLVGGAAPAVFDARTSLGAMAAARFLFYRGKHGHRVHGRTQSLADMLLGPGYFTAAKGDERAPVILRYGELPDPDDKPEGWPAVAANDRGLGSFTYDKVEIALRSVDDGLFVGEIWSRGRSLSTHVTLLRAP